MPQVIPAVIGGLKVIGGGSAIWGAVQVATAVGSVVYSSSQASKLRRAMKTSSLDQGRSVMVRNPIAPRRLIYGQVLLSGTIVFIHATGTKNEYLHLVVVLAGHEVEEIGTIYFNDEIVPLSGVSATGKYAGFASVYKEKGAPGAAANASLITECPGVWTSDHKLSGCAYLYVRLKWSPDLFPNGLPTVRALVKGKKVYDPRDEDQDPDDPTTWKWSNNSALCDADYLHDPIFGKGVPWSRIRLS